jgi:AbrB family looped-hinge helix DNA binding protein
VLPKELRERFRLRPGSRLAIEVKGDHLLLRPVEQEPVLVQEGGWWVYRGGTTDPDELVDAVQRHREDRLVDLSR